ncbi:MAG TPA: sigma-54 dependent transcriptional regulator [Ignavibacteriaceae bacterium]|nr:sigma-54 dependent transcriptional regulator [Ignavibacteriaceae bacterium]
MKNSQILIVDDEPAFLRSIRRLFWERGYENITIEQNSNLVLGLLKEKRFDLILLDISMPGIDGIELLENITVSYPEIPAIMVTAIDKIETALKAIKLGAYDYLTKPPDTERLFITVERALEQRLLKLERDSLRKPETELKPDGKFSDIITNSQLMFKVFELVKIFAPTNETILIDGETGTGKDLIAKKIHELSPRFKNPFISVNLAAISSSLFESELFGYEKGSFTGAVSDKKGFFEAANTGTLFLDEIGELNKELQGKLLRAIQYSEIYRIGSRKPIKLDLRIIAATNKELYKSVQTGDFRADLYYRLNRGFIHLPPLRMRSEDIKPLSEHFIRLGNSTYNKNVMGISNNIIEVLRSYEFPGNIRELENLILNSLAKTKDGELINEIDLPVSKVNLETKPGTGLISLDEAEKKHILYVLDSVDGNLQKAAYILGVSERTMQRKIQKLKEENRF